MSSKDARSKLARAFGKEDSLDPLAKWESTLVELAESGIDPFDMWMDELHRQNKRPATITGYESTIRQWREFMDEEGRHPACPNEDHARDWVAWLRAGKHNRGNGKPNTSATISQKLHMMSAIYDFWQREPEFPGDYNELHPFHLALKKEQVGKEHPGEYPRLSVADVRRGVHSIKHIRDRAMAVMLFKLGCRAGEVANIQIRDVKIEGDELRERYPDLGTNPMVRDHENAIYIPPREDPTLPWEGRTGNKSKRPRVMPLDAELRRTIRRVLLIRPKNPEGWLFLSKSTHSKLESEIVNNPVAEALEPFNEDGHRKLTSHFGRHFHTTHFRNLDTEAEFVKYMRGDTSAEDVDGAAVMNQYIHTYPEDIRDVWMDNIYLLNV